MHIMWQFVNCKCMSPFDTTKDGVVELWRKPSWEKFLVKVLNLSIFKNRPKQPRYHFYPAKEWWREVFAILGIHSKHNYAPPPSRWMGTLPPSYSILPLEITLFKIVPTKFVYKIHLIWLSLSVLLRMHFIPSNLTT